MFKKISYSLYKEESVFGRYITLEHLEPILDNLDSNFHFEEVGSTVKGNPITLIKWGVGSIKVMMWSQMHGNESTTTKALFDLFNFLKDTSNSDKLFKNLTLYIIPILNPDGALRYTRENANGIDLNRDFLNLSQPESKVLMHIYKRFNPDFCFNLHDQRTIFGVGDTGKPATLSFLSPASDETRVFNEAREKSAAVIVAINTLLQNEIPGQIGRFDDTYNRNCSGDTFQTFGTPTILFEAGHYPNDYEREITRKYVFYALIEGLRVINENDIVDNKIEDYLNILQNNPCFYDIVCRNIKINYENSNLISNFAIQFSEVLFEKKIQFEAIISALGTLEDKFGHVEYDFEGELYEDSHENIPILGNIADFKVGSALSFKNGKMINLNKQLK